MSAPGRVLKELAALPDLTDEDRAAAEACFRAAKDADDLAWLYDLSAPIVMLLVLPLSGAAPTSCRACSVGAGLCTSLNGEGEAVFNRQQVLAAGRGIQLEDATTALVRTKPVHSIPSPLVSCCKRQLSLGKHRHKTIQLNF